MMLSRSIGQAAKLSKPRLLTPTLRQGLRSTEEMTMETQSGELRRIKAFATEAGVSVRTLHLYDRLGLLRPAALSESGYRLYGEAELERLEHILALRFVGLRLDQIKSCLDDPTGRWSRRCACSAK